MTGVGNFAPAVLWQSPVFHAPVWQAKLVSVTDIFVILADLVRITSFPILLNCCASKPSDGTETVPPVGRLS